MANIDQIQTSTRTSEEYEEGYLKQLWLEKGCRWNSYIFEFLTLYKIQDLNFVISQVLNYNPIPDLDCDAPWLPYEALPTSGCLQRLEYLWKLLLKRWKNEKGARECPEDLPVDPHFIVHQLRIYMRLIKSLEISAGTHTLRRLSSTSLPLRTCCPSPSYLYLFPWSIFMSRDIDVLIRQLSISCINWNPYAVTLVFFEPSLWNGSFFWNKEDQQKALKVFMGNIAPTMISLRLSCTTKLLSIPCSSFSSDAICIEPLLNMVLYSILFNVCFEFLHTLCSRLLVYITKEKYFLTTYLSKYQKSILCGVYEQFIEHPCYEDLKLLMALKQLCLQYVMFREKFLLTQELKETTLDEPCISFRTFMTLTVFQRCHLIFSQLCTYYVHKTIDEEKHEQCIEFSGLPFRNVLEQVFYQPFKMFSMQTSQDLKLYVWEPFRRLYSLSSDELVQLFRIPSLTSLSSISKEKSDGVVVISSLFSQLKENVQQYSTTALQVIFFYYLHILLKEKESAALLHHEFGISKYFQTESKESYYLEYTSTVCLLKPNVDAYPEKNDSSSLNTALQNSEEWATWRNDRIFIKLCPIESLFILMGIEILNFFYPWDSDILLAKSLVGLIHCSFSFLSLEYYNRLFSSLLNLYTTLSCKEWPSSRDVLSSEKTLTIMWTCTFVRLLDYKALARDLDQLGSCVSSLSLLHEFSFSDFLHLSLDDGAVYFLRRLIPLVFSQTHDVTRTKKFFSLHQSLFRRLSLGRFCVETLRLLCMPEPLTVHPGVRDFVSAWYEHSVATRQTRDFLTQLETCLGATVESALWRKKRFDFPLFAFGQEVLCLYDPYVGYTPNKTFPPRLHKLRELLYLAHDCLHLYQECCLDPYGPHSFEKTLANRLSNTVSSNTENPCVFPPKYLDPTWLAMHFHDPVLLVHQLLQHASCLSHPPKWAMVEEIFEKWSGKKIDSPALSLSLVQIVSLWRQNQFPLALRRFCLLSKSLCKEPVNQKSLLSRWNKTLDKTYGFFLQGKVETLRWHFVDRLLFFLESLLVTDPSLLSWDTTSPGWSLLQQAAVLVCQGQLPSQNDAPSSFSTQHTCSNASSIFGFTSFPSTDKLLEWTERFAHIYQLIYHQDSLADTFNTWQGIPQIAFSSLSTTHEIVRGNLEWNDPSSSAPQPLKALSSAATSFFFTPIGLTSKGIADFSSSLFYPFYNSTHDIPIHKPENEIHDPLQQIVQSTKIYSKTSQMTHHTNNQTTSAEQPLEPKIFPPNLMESPQRHAWQDSRSFVSSNQFIDQAPSIPHQDIPTRVSSALPIHTSSPQHSDQPCDTLSCTVERHVDEHTVSEDFQNKNITEWDDAIDSWNPIQPLATRSSASSSESSENDIPHNITALENETSHDTSKKASLSFVPSLPLAAPTKEKISCPPPQDFQKLFDDRIKPEPNYSDALFGSPALNAEPSMTPTHRFTTSTEMFPRLYDHSSLSVPYISSTLTFLKQSFVVPSKKLWNGSNDHPTTLHQPLFHQDTEANSSPKRYTEWDDDALCIDDDMFNSTPHEKASPNPAVCSFNSDSNEKTKPSITSMSKETTEAAGNNSTLLDFSQPRQGGQCFIHDTPQQDRPLAETLPEKQVISLVTRQTGMSRQVAINPSCQQTSGEPLLVLRDTQESLIKHQQDPVVCFEKEAGNIHHDLQKTFLPWHTSTMDSFDKHGNKTTQDWEADLIVCDDLIASCQETSPSLNDLTPRHNTNLSDPPRVSTHTDTLPENQRTTASRPWTDTNQVPIAQKPIHFTPHNGGWDDDLVLTDDSHGSGIKKMDSSFIEPFNENDTSQTLDHKNLFSTHEASASLHNTLGETKSYVFEPPSTRFRPETCSSPSAQQERATSSCDGKPSLANDNDALPENRNTPSVFQEKTYDSTNSQLAHPSAAWSTHNVSSSNDDVHHEVIHPEGWDDDIFSRTSEDTFGL